jgi:hypothetical protein
MISPFSAVDSLNLRIFSVISRTTLKTSPEVLLKRWRSLLKTTEPSDLNLRTYLEAVCFQRRTKVRQAKSLVVDKRNVDFPGRIRESFDH